MPLLIGKNTGWALPISGQYALHPSPSLESALMREYGPRELCTRTSQKSAIDP